ncbi:hypothetical protein QFZ42_003340 [Variovorax paradoxus]|nr:hypothetical protein [Variovorax paradoxus]
MQHVHTAALLGLADLLVSASNPSAARHPARHDDEDKPDAEEDQEGVHGGSLKGCPPSFKEQCEFHNTHALERGRQNGRGRNHKAPPSVGSGDPTAIRCLSDVSLSALRAASCASFARHTASRCDCEDRIDCSFWAGSISSSSAEDAGSLPGFASANRRCASIKAVWIAVSTTSCAAKISNWPISGLGFLLGALASAPRENRASLFACDAGELFELRRVSRGYEALPAPVVHRLFGDIQCDRNGDL